MTSSEIYSVHGEIVIMSEGHARCRFDFAVNRNPMALFFAFLCVSAHPAPRLADA